MKKFFCIFVVALMLFIVGCNNSDDSITYQLCPACEENVSIDAFFCQYCGAELNQTSQSHAEAILGTWKHEDDIWGEFTYSFYPDGSCVGDYSGRVGGVEPSLFPEAYYEAGGNGAWRFEQGQIMPVLVILYNGTPSDNNDVTVNYEYSFNEDYTELTVWGVPTHRNKPRHAVVWTKVQ